MALTQEEIDKIHAEEAERAKIRAQIAEEEKSKKPTSGKKKKITLGHILAWIVSIFLAFYAIGMSSVSDKSSVIAIMIAFLIIFPPLASYMDRKWNFHLSRPLKVIAVTILFIVSMIMSVSGITKNLQNNTSNTNTSPSSEQTQQQAMDAKTIEELQKIEIVSYSIDLDSIGTPHLKVKIKNNSDRAIDAVTFGAFFVNNYGEPVGEFHSKSRERFGGIFQETINPGKTTSGDWNLAVYDNATKVDSIGIEKIHYVDGETYTIPQ